MQSDDLSVVSEAQDTSAASKQTFRTVDKKQNVRHWNDKLVHEWKDQRWALAVNTSYGSQMAFCKPDNANTILPCMSDMGQQFRGCKYYDVQILYSCRGVPLKYNAKIICLSFQ